MFSSSIKNPEEQLFRIKQDYFDIRKLDKTYNQNLQSGGAKRKRKSKKNSLDCGEITDKKK